MGFLFAIAVAAVVVAEDFIELEPVRALTQTCSIYDGANNREACHARHSCYFRVSDAKCITDPCYKWISDEAAGNDCSIPGGAVTCEVKTYTTYTPDCSSPGTTSTYKYCSGQDQQPATMTFCEYEWLKSNKTKCPSYFCQVSGVGVGGTFEICDAVTSGGCPSNTDCSCLTEDYCSLNPYCYVKDHQCIRDLCTAYFDDQDQGCASRKDVQATLGINDDCMSFEIFDGATGHANGATKGLCVNSQRNKTPNKCYFLSNGFVETGNAPCKVYTIPKCSENEECVAQTNTSGPYKDYYCGDAQHSSSSFMVHAPAMIMIVLAVFAFLL